jgi:hypothetical protein
MNKRKVFSVKGKFKMKQELEGWGEKRRYVFHQEFVPITSKNPNNLYLLLLLNGMD